MTTTDPSVFAVRDATAHDELTVLRLLASGRDITFTAEAAQLTEHQVAHIAGAAGHPDPDKLLRAADLVQQQIDRDAAPGPPARTLTRRAAPARPGTAQRQAAPAALAPVEAPQKAAGTDPDTDPPLELVADLIRGGLQSDKIRTRGAAQKVVDAAKGLQTRLEAEAAARAEQDRDARKREKILTEMRSLEGQIAALKQQLRPRKPKKPAAKGSRR